MQLQVKNVERYKVKSYVDDQDENEMSIHFVDYNITRIVLTVCNRRVYLSYLD